MTDPKQIPASVVTPFNGWEYHCYDCGEKIILETCEELFAATRAKSICEACSEERKLNQ